MSEGEIHPAGTSQGENDSEEVRAEVNEEEVTRSLRSKMCEGAQKVASLSSACIFRVPEKIRKLNESAYTPRLIAIGPLHRNDPHLQISMQHFKTSYMNKLLCRMTQGMENQEAEQKKIRVLVECVAAMEMSIEDAKKCYAEEVPQLDAEMMLIDGCFILELLYQFYIHRNGYREGLEDPIFANTMTRFDVQHDLLLLENQIPFFVLDKLFKLTLAQIPNLIPFLVRERFLPPTEAQIPTLAQNPNLAQILTLAQIPTMAAFVFMNLSLNDYVFLKQVDDMMRPVKGQSTNSTSSAKTSCWPRDCIRWVSGKKMNNSEAEVKVPRNAKRYQHILHKLHDDYLPHDQTVVKEERTEELPSASELVNAGVKFIRGTGDNLFKVEFIEPKGLLWWYQRARFKIPFLLIDDSTESVLRNLIAFEQCCPGTSQHFTSYARLVNMLVNYDKDVQVLERAGVLRNCLGAAKDVTELFNNLSKEVSYREFFFADQCNRAIKYSKCFWPKNMAYLRSKYFASPWKFIAFCLAIVAFGVSIAILVFTILLK